MKYEDWRNKAEGDNVSPFGSTNFTGLSAQYTYGLSEGYFEACGSKLSQMLKSEL